MTTFEVHDLGNNKKLIVYNFKMGNMTNKAAKKLIDKQQKQIKKGLDRMFEEKNQYILYTIATR